MDVQALRNYVREVLDVDDEELPDSLLNVFLQEAFDRTMAFDNRWPRNQMTWNLTKPAGSDSIPLPAELNIPSIVSIVSTVTPGLPLILTNQETAEQMFIRFDTVAVGTPSYISVWAGQLWLWPRYDTATEYGITLRGYRQPVWTNGASDIPDLDTRLHATLAYFAIALAYAQQEDEVLEAVYMARWERDLRMQLRSLLAPVRNTPLVMSGARVQGVSSYVINPPGP